MKSVQNKTRKSKKKVIVDTTKELNALLSAGTYMSNLLFNAENDKTIPELWRQEFKRYRSIWDRDYGNYVAVKYQNFTSSGE